MLTLISSIAFAQNEISIGQPVPDIKLQLFNAPYETAQLSSFKGKAVILDFWSSGCLACVAVFPKMDSLNEVFKDHLQVLLVNSVIWKDDMEKMKNTYVQVRKRRPSFNLPTVYNDSVLMKYFRHSIIPHYVWLDKDGIVRAITGKNEVTAGNIEKFLHAGYNDMEVKRDVNINKLLFTTEALPVDKLLKYSILIKGEYGGLTKQSSKWVKDEKRYRAVYTEFPLQNIYENIANNLGFGKKMFLMEGDSIENHLAELYSYDFMVSVNRAGELFRLMMQDLNTYLDISCKIEKRKTSCWVIKYAGTNKQSDSSDLQPLPTYPAIHHDTRELEFKEMPVRYLSTQLNNFANEVPLVIDESGYQGKISIKVKANDFESIKRELRKYKIEIVEEERMVDFFVVSR